MSSINILDDKTINRIAAGEVVERPASIVKELVENSIDAGASTISIEIKGGGIDFIRVSDNGSGMTRDDIPRAFLRHATSKIHSADDLANVSSLGFRGEALASIAAVSKVEMMTKTSGSVLGYRYRIQGGKEMSFDEAGVSDGTTIIVRDLFYNTPARRKFLRSASSEGNSITALVESLILSHPGISFRYLLGGTLKLSADGGGNVISDIYAIYGRDASQNCVEVCYASENINITGYAGKPAIARGNRNCEMFFVNGRYIKSKVICAAAEEAYKPYLMLHRFPFVILYIDIPTDNTDVNVHPSKTEIRFSDEKYVYEAVKEAVSSAIIKKELIPEIKEEDVSGIVMSAPSPEKDTASAPVVPEPFDSINMDTFREAAQRWHEKEDAVLKETDNTLFKEGFMGEAQKEERRIIGQVFDTYWIAQFDGRMYIMDQHAAHEKVLYERLCKRISEGDVISQMISPPYIVSLSASQEDTLRENLDLLAQTGFTVSHFGGHEYALSAVPCELFGMGEQEYFLSIVDGLKEYGRAKDPQEVKDRIAGMACKAAVKGNMRMSTLEAKALIDELMSLENPYNCPHGRPTIISFSEKELEKMFKRIV